MRAENKRRERRRQENKRRENTVERKEGNGVRLQTF
jgi:hypothetical protein